MRATITRSTLGTLTWPVVIGATIWQCWALAAPADLSGFSAADCISEGAAANSRLIVFPFGTKNFSIPIPRILRRVVYGASGRVLFATSFKQIGEKSVSTLPGLVKIDFNPVRVTEIPGLNAFQIGRFAVSREEDMVLFEGLRLDLTGPGTCGIYKYELSTKYPTAVLETSDCKAGAPWGVIDLSPGNKDALIVVNLKSVARLDLASRQVSPIPDLGGPLRVGAYSPDGEWIAAIDPFPGRTALIDSRDFSVRRGVGKSDGFQPAWSPDSRLILQLTNQSHCRNNNFTLETVEVKTGKKLVIPNSACHVGSDQIGWVRNDIEN